MECIVKLPATSTQLARKYNITTTRQSVFGFSFGKNKDEEKYRNYYGNRIKVTSEWFIIIPFYVILISYKNSLNNEL